MSIGSKHLRVVLLGLDFKPIEPSVIEGLYGFPDIVNAGKYELVESETNVSYCFKTPETFEGIQKIVKSIVLPMLKKSISSGKQSTANSSNFHLMGIGFAVSGPVDYKDKMWCSAPRIAGINKITLRDLMGGEAYQDALDNYVFLSLDNNAKAAIVSEYQWLMEQKRDYKDDENKILGDVALLYIGTGIGMAYVVGWKLMRGDNNLSGEAGQLRLIHNDERVIEDLTSGEKIDAYYKYIPYVLNAITCITGIDSIILIGHSISKKRNLPRRVYKQNARSTNHV